MGVRAALLQRPARLAGPKQFAGLTEKLDIGRADSAEIRFGQSADIAKVRELGSLLARDPCLEVEIFVDKEFYASGEIVNLERLLDQFAMQSNRLEECVCNQLFLLGEVISQTLQIKPDFRSDEREGRISQAVKVDQRPCRLHHFILAVIEPGALGRHPFCPGLSRFSRHSWISR